MNSNEFIYALSKENQEKIKRLITDYLVKEGYDDDKIKETLGNVMSERLWVISDIIDIEPFLFEGKVIKLKEVL